MRAKAVDVRFTASIGDVKERMMAYSMNRPWECLWRFEEVTDSSRLQVAGAQVAEAHRPLDALRI
jgi:hypothetical protein